MVLETHGWKVLYHPLFGDRYNELRARVRKLKEQLTADAFRAHPVAKLLKAVSNTILETVPLDPNRADFWLVGDLARFRRVKKHGLPDRFRLFYAFSSEAKTIIYLYLNDRDTLRKKGAKTDPYEIFGDLVSSGRIGKDFEANYEQWQRARAQRAGEQERDKRDEDG